MLLLSVVKAHELPPTERLTNARQCLRQITEIPLTCCDRPLEVSTKAFGKFCSCKTFRPLFSHWSNLDSCSWFIAIHMWVNNKPSLP